MKRPCSSADDIVLSTAGDNEIDQLRTLLVQQQSEQERTRERLDALQQARDISIKSSRKTFLKSLEEHIGAPPDRDWREELLERAELLVKWCDSNKVQDEWTVENARSLLDRDPERVWTGNKDLRYGEGARLIQAFSSPDNKYIKDMIASGWSYEDAATFQTLTWPRARIAMAHGLSIANPSLAACTYALSDAMFRQSTTQVQAGIAPPLLFRHLHGMFSLAEADAAWASIEEPDSTGFRGLTSPVLVRARRGAAPDIDCFDATGFKQFNLVTRRYEVQPSAVVCFISDHASDQGMHAAIVTECDEGQPILGALPPNTLYHLVEVKPPGWMAPNGVAVNQRLLVVRATYRLPRSSAADDSASKLCGSVVTLQYGSRATYIAGLSDIIDRPVLSMAHEFNRDFRWIDWKGVAYSLRSEWQYVTGPAVTKDDCTPGRRDSAHDGKSPDGFLCEMNAFIRERREQSELIRGRLPEEFAFLTRDEVLAVRLYSGPAYQPLNDFLRQASTLRPPPTSYLNAQPESCPTGHAGRPFEWRPPARSDSGPPPHVLGDHRTHRCGDSQASGREYSRRGHATIVPWCARRTSTRVLASRQLGHGLRDRHGVHVVRNSLSNFALLLCQPCL